MSSEDRQVESGAVEVETVEPAARAPSRSAPEAAVAGASAHAGGRAGSRGTDFFWANLLAIVAVGVGGCFWVLYYTDLFPVVGGLLGLGGAFVWIAFLARVVRKERQERLQTWLDEAVLTRAQTLGAVVVLALGLLASMSWHGTLAVTHVQGGTDRVLRVVDADGNEVLAPTRLAPGARQKHVIGTGLFGSVDAWVEVTGLPAVRQQVSAWQRPELSVPSSFLARPVVLLRPTAALSNTARNNEFRLAVRIDGAGGGEIAPYRGELVWIGCAAEVAVPAERRERWQRELGPLPPPLGWSQPRAVAERLTLAPGTRLYIEVLKSDGAIYTGAEVVVDAPVAAQFPQEVVLDVP